MKTSQTLFTPVLTFLSAGLLGIGTLTAGDAEAAEPWSLCDVFDLATFYEGGEGALIESIAMSGRLHVDAAFFRESPDEEFQSFHWRRFRNGFVAKFRGGFTLHSEAEMDWNEQDPVYDRLTDTYLSWSPGDELEIKVGKHSAAFTMDGKTSSKRLIRPERSVLNNNLWFPEEYHSGVAASGEVKGWVYDLGYFSSAGGNEFGDFEGGFFGLVSIGRDIGGLLGLDKALVAVDYVHNDEDEANFGTRDLANVISLNGKFELGDFGVWTDVGFGDGYRKQSDLFAVAIMPFYNLTEKLQLVTSYNYVTSDEVNGVRLDRYESSVVGGRADVVHELYCGLNYYFCGHKLKWHNGVEYTTASDAANDGGEYDGWGYTSALRMYW